MLFSSPKKCASQSHDMKVYFFPNTVTEMHWFLIPMLLSCYLFIYQLWYRAEWAPNPLHRVGKGALIPLPTGLIGLDVSPTYKYNINGASKMIAISFEVSEFQKSEIVNSTDCLALLTWNQRGWRFKCFLILKAPHSNKCISQCVLPCREAGSDLDLSLLNVKDFCTLIEN